MTDPLRQFPVDATTRPDATTVESARRGIEAHISHTNLQDAMRALWLEDARRAREAGGVR